MWQFQNGNGSDELYQVILPWLRTKWSGVMPTFSHDMKKLGAHLRAVIKNWGPRISPGYYERGPQLLSQENRRKLEPKENSGCLIPSLLVVFTQQLGFLVTALAHLLSNNIWSFFKKITTVVGQRPKLEQLRPNKSGELEIIPTHVL